MPNEETEIRHEDAAYALAARIADLIVENSQAATHPNFFVALDTELASRDYALRAHQHGVRGTYVCIEKLVNLSEDVGVHSKLDKEANPAPGFAFDDGLDTGPHDPRNTD